MELVKIATRRGCEKLTNPLPPSVQITVLVYTLEKCTRKVIKV